MAKKRVFLDECCSELGNIFPAKTHVYTAQSLGVTGKEDTRVIDEAVKRKCLIVTVNKDFVEYYRNHPRRKGKSGTYFYMLIFLMPSRQRKKQLRLALQTTRWDDTRRHDDLIRVSATGKTRYERLCHKECAARFPKDQTEWD